MSQRHNQNCVLCNASAEYCLADSQKRKHFFCPKCTEYEITDTAELKLQSSTPEVRAQYANKASVVGPDMVLSIFVPSVQKVEGIAYESLRGEPTRREDLSPCR